MRLADKPPNSRKGSGKMITRDSAFAASIGTLACATLAQAHPGHGEPGDDYSLLHYVTEPLHLGIGICLLIGTMALVGLARNAYRRRKKRASAA